MNFTFCEGLGDQTKKFFLSTSMLYMSHGLSGCEIKELQVVESQGIHFYTQPYQAVFDLQSPRILEKELIEKKQQNLKETSFNPVPHYAIPYVGRFEIEVRCDQKFIACKEGSAKLVLILLPNGKLHRSLIEYGKVFQEEVIDSSISSAANYNEDYWFVDPLAQELRVVRADGLELFYHIISVDHFILNVDKVHQVNAKLFATGYHAPTERYELKRVQDVLK